MAADSSLDRIGVGIDTARYGHRVCFLRPDLQPAAKPLTVTENRAGYQALQQRLEQLHARYPNANFRVRIDAAGQYALNLEHFLRALPLPITLSIGEPKRNKDYRMAHFPKRTNDDVESQAMARFAIVEPSQPTPGASDALILLREVAGRLQGQVKQTTRAVNRLHNLLARTFPELAQQADDLSAAWVLRLLERYPTPQRLAQARRASLEKLPHLSAERAEALHQAAQQSVASLHGPVAEEMVRTLVAELRHCQQAERQLRALLGTAFEQLPAAPHRQLVTIPGIGLATAAVLAAKIGDIDRFPTPNHLVNYFGIFPEESTSGVDKHGKARPAGPLPMSRKGNDLVRAYLWNAAWSAIRCNPAVRALYRRLKARGKRGDVALGQCMRKLLLLVYAVWKTDRPFDPKHYPWEAAAPAAGPDAAVAVPADETAVGHKRDEPAREVVTTADSTVAPAPPAVKPAPSSGTAVQPKVDFAFLRQQITMKQVLGHLDLMGQLHGRGLQRRGPCPLHSHPGDAERTFSVHLGKHVFRCFHAGCGAQGNVLDFWAAMHRLSLYDAALHLAETFQLRRNREEEPVRGTRVPTGILAPARPADTGQATD